MPTPGSGQREGGPGAGWHGGNPRAFPPPALSASGARFPPSNLVFLISAAPLCQQQAVLGSALLCGVTRTAQSCPSPVAEPRGRAWVPEVAVAAGCCGFGCCSHKQREPLCCSLREEIAELFVFCCSSWARQGGSEGSRVLGARAGLWCSSCHGVPMQEQPWELCSISVTPNSAPQQSPRKRLQAALTSRLLCPEGTWWPLVPVGSSWHPWQDLPQAFPADGFYFPPPWPLPPAREGFLGTAL